MAIIKSRMKHFRMSPAREAAVNKALESMPWIRSFTDLMERALQEFLVEHVPLNGDLAAIQAKAREPAPVGKHHADGKSPKEKDRILKKGVFQEKLELKNGPTKKKKAKK